jgi:cellulose biosynthesis protein BcsQ
MSISFDNSLPILVEWIVDRFEASCLSDCVALRDTTGRLSVFVDRSLSEQEIADAAESLRSRLDAYARDDRVIADRNAPGAQRILDDPDARLATVGEHQVRVVDRRLVGPDWQEPPEPNDAVPTRVVFASLKGGVGRSTALGVLAADQARRGRNVLVIDLDLEAPGVGTLLLDDERRPELGVLDYLVENGLNGIDDSELPRFVGTSRLTTGAGLVAVAPVVGTIGLAAPHNYLAKLSRALVEDLRPDQPPATLREQIKEMVDRLANHRPYDVVLIDARAGLSEIAAGPILGLGAHVLLFGTAQPQTTEGLTYLLAHLSSLVQPGEEPTWQTRLRMVHAKASMSDTEHERFRDQLWDLFLEYLYEEADDLEGFSFDVNDPDAPHFPWSIPFDQRFVDWDPLNKPTELTRSFYEATFRPFIDNVEKLLPATAQP